FEGLRDFLGSRRLAGRIGLADESPGEAPRPIHGDGPPFWAPTVASGRIELRLTNTGSVAWPAGVDLVAAWVATDLPYLPGRPAALESLDVEIPRLEPGQSVRVEVTL